MQKRVSDQLNFEQNLSSITRLRHGATDGDSAKILRHVAEVMPCILLNPDEVGASVVLDLADRLGLHGRRAQKFHELIADNNIHKTAIFIFAARHGLTSIHIRGAFHDIQHGHPHRLNEKLLAMTQFFKPEIIYPMVGIPLPPHRPLDVRSPASVKKIER